MKFTRLGTYERKEHVKHFHVLCLIHFLIVRLYHTAGWLDLRPVSLGSPHYADSLLYSLPLISPYLLISVFSIVVEPYSTIYKSRILAADFLYYFAFYRTSLIRAAPRYIAILGWYKVLSERSPQFKRFRDDPIFIFNQSSMSEQGYINADVENTFSGFKSLFTSSVPEFSGKP